MGRRQKTTPSTSVMKKPLIIEPEAERDIANAYEWYEQQRSGLGDDFALCLEAGLQTIRERPRSFPRIRRAARRMLIQRFPYLMLFVERRDFIAVHGVFHTSRNRNDGKIDFDHSGPAPTRFPATIWQVVPKPQAKTPRST